MATDLITSCPHCRRETAASERLFGSSIRCPGCLRDFVFESVSFGTGRSASRGQAPAVAASRANADVPAGDVKAPRGDVGVTAPAVGSPPGRRAPSERIGRFELRERVGEGSFGVVFRAFDPVLDREVAIKVPRVPFADDRERRRFLAEAKSAARLRHPGIVGVHEAGFADGRPFIAAEFVRGQTLADRLKAGRPPADLAAAWVRDLARALAYAHAEGVVHRDVKPGNVMLDAHDRPQLMDFGLARSVGADSSLTAEGSLLGTPVYMSPEQARGETAAVGPRSDQYSLGAVLYELLCGAKPFTGPPHAVVALVASPEDPRPLRDRDPSVPRDLESICRKAMEKDPRHRYDDEASFADDLARWLAGDETLARPLGPVERLRRWSRRRPGVASLAVAVFLTASIGFTAVLHQWRRAERHLAESLRQEARNGELLKEVKRQRDEVKRQHESVGQERDAARAALALAERERAAAEQALAESKRQRLRADQADRQAADLSDRVEGEQAEAARHRAEARRIAVGRDAERAQQLAESDQVPAGFLFAAKALESLPPDSGDLEWHLRMNLSLLRRPLHELVGMIEAGDPVRSLDVDPTGLLVATGHDDGTVKVWSAERGTESLPSRSYDGPARVVRFSPDAKRLLICAGDGIAELVEIAEPAAPAEPLRHPAAVLSAAFDGAGRKIVTGSEDRLARIWTGSTARLVLPPLQHDGPVRAVALSPDGKLLLTGTASLARRVTLWDADAGRLLSVLHEGTADVTAVAFDPDAELMAAGTADGLVRFWMTADRAPTRRTLKVEGPIRSMAFTPSGRLLVAAGDGAARLWNVEAGQPDGPPLAHAGRVTGVACERAGEGLLTGGEDGVVRLWRYAGSKQVEGPVRHDSPVTQVALRGDGGFLATGDVAGAVRLFDVTQGAAVGEPLLLAEAVSALAFRPDGRAVAAGGLDGSARLLATDSAKPFGQRMRHDGPVTSVAFSPDGSRLLTTERDGPARLWAADSGKSLGKPLALDGGVRVAAFSPDGSRVATGGAGTLRVWAADGSVLGEPLPVAGRVRSLAFSRDGQTLLSGTETGDVARWSVDEGKQLAPAFSHGGALHTVAFGPDGRLALTAGADRSVRLWDSETGTPFGPPLTHGDEVTFARLRAEGRFLVTGTKSGDVSFWDAVLGRRIGLPLRAAGPIAGFAAADDDTVIAVAGGNSAHVWKVPPPLMMSPERAVAWAELITGLDGERDGGASLGPEEWQDRRTRLEASDDPAAPGGGP